MTEQVETQPELRTDGINLSSAAASKVKSLLDQEGRNDLKLRIAVQPGGCSGMRYQLFFDERDLDGDIVTDFGGVEVVVDRMSSPYLNGALIDFVDSIEKQGFTIDNPNAGGVTITLSLIPPDPPAEVCVELAVQRTVRVTLESALGGRGVLDGSASPRVRVERVATPYR